MYSDSIFSTRLLPDYGYVPEGAADRAGILHWKPTQRALIETVNRSSGAREHVDRTTHGAEPVPGCVTAFHTRVKRLHCREPVL